MADLLFGVRLQADGTAYIGTVRAAREETEALSAAARATGATKLTADAAGYIGPINSAHDAIDRLSAAGRAVAEANFTANTAGFTGPVQGAVAEVQKLSAAGQQANAGISALGASGAQAGAGIASIGAGAQQANAGVSTLNASTSRLQKSNDALIESWSKEAILLGKTRSEVIGLTAAHSNMTAEQLKTVTAIQQVHAAYAQQVQAAKDAGKATRDGLAAGASGADVLGRAVSAVKSQLLALASVGAIIGFAKQFAESSDALTTLNARLVNATGSIAAMRVAQAALYDTAAKLQFSYRDLAGSFVDVAEGLREMGKDGTVAARVVETLSAATRADGQSSEQAAALIGQFAQAMTLGVDGGKAFAAILRSNNSFARELADQLGVTTTELKRMAQDGEISTTQLADLTASMAERMTAAAAKMPITIGGAFNELGDSLAKMFSGGGAGGVVAKWLHDIAGELKFAGDNALSFGDRIRVALAGIVGGSPGALDAIRKLREDAGKAPVRQVSGVIGGQQGEPQENPIAQAAFDRLVLTSQSAEGVRANTQKAKDLILKSWGELSTTNADAIQKNYDTAIALLNNEDAKMNAALEAISKRGGVSFSAFAGIQDKRAEIEIAGASVRLKVEQDEANRAIGILEFQHSQLLVSEEQYIAQRLALEQRGAQASIDHLQQSYQATLAEFQTIQTRPTIGADEAAAKAAKLDELQKKLIEDTVALDLAYKALGDTRTRADQAGEVYIKKLIAYQATLNVELADYNRTTAKRLADQQFAISILQLDSTQQAAATAAREEIVRADDKIYDIEKKIALLRADPSQAAANAAQIEALTAQGEEIRKNGQSAAAAAAQGAAATDQWRLRTEDLRNAWQLVDDTAWQFIQKLRGGWKSAMDYMKDVLTTGLLRTLYEMTLRKWVLNIFTDVTGAGAGITQGGNTALSFLGLAGGGGGIGGSGGFGGFSGIGQLLGLGTAGPNFLTGLGNLGAGVGNFTELLGQGVGVFNAAAGAFTGLGSSFAAVLGPIGIAATAATFLVQYLNSKKGGPMTREYGTSGADISTFGDFSATHKLVGTDAVTSEAYGSAARQAQADYLAAVKALGGTPGNAQFAIYTSSDTKGKAPEQVDVRATLGGQAAYTANVQDQIKHGDTAGAAARAALETDRAIFAALQQSKLPQLVGDFIKRFDATTISSETIKSVEAFAQAMAAVNLAASGNVLEDAQKALATAQLSSTEVLRKMGQTVVDLANASDGSVQSITDLANATSQYRQAAVAAIIAIRQIASALHDMFAQTRETIEFAGLDKQQRYNLDQSKGSDLLNQITTSNDPAFIKSASEKIDKYFNDAFGLLDPKEQLAHKQEFLDKLNEVDTLTNQRLSTIADNIGTDTAGPFAAAQKALDDAATKFQKAAETQQKAADTFNKAAGTISAAADTFAEGATVNVAVVPTPQFEPAVGGGG